MAEKSSLQQAREVAGLSVEQIASLTNIRPAVIRDLENNLVEVCGGIAYARGHIRSIVKVINQKTPKSINIDADLLVAEMEQSQDQDNRPMINRLAENNVAEKLVEQLKEPILSEVGSPTLINEQDKSSKENLLNVTKDEVVNDTSYEFIKVENVIKIIIEEKIRLGKLDGNLLAENILFRIKKGKWD